MQILRLQQGDGQRVVINKNSERAEKKRSDAYGGSFSCVEIEYEM